MLKKLRCDSLTLSIEVQPLNKVKEDNCLIHDFSKWTLKYTSVTLRLVRTKSTGIKLSRNYQCFKISNLFGRFDEM